MKTMMWMIVQVFELPLELNDANPSLGAHEQHVYASLSCVHAELGVSPSSRTPQSLDNSPRQVFDHDQPPVYTEVEVNVPVGGH
ncbi:hypothetical protein Hypma_001282 [Hypsizygus marmoreus]|uniref:Uncharacterized protein n=1 Tax=Hypsizygus marmoreus TaxID=39966 RepID=A0A369JF46_HYPMA|nr:hypothetical protein Hypma_001282 [Hypsizygus marmoreus]